MGIIGLFGRKKRVRIIPTKKERLKKFPRISILITLAHLNLGGPWEIL